MQKRKYFGSRHIDITAPSSSNFNQCRLVPTIWLRWMQMNAGQKGVVLSDVIKKIRCTCHLEGDRNVPGVTIQRRFISYTLHSNTLTPRNSAEFGIPLSVVILHTIKSIYPNQLRWRVHKLQTKQSAIVECVQCAGTTRIRDHRYTIMG